MRGEGGGRGEVVQSSQTEAQQVTTQTAQGSHISFLEEATLPRIDAIIVIEINIRNQLIIESQTSDKWKLEAGL